MELIKGHKYIHKNIWNGVTNIITFCNIYESMNHICNVYFPSQPNIPISVYVKDLYPLDDIKWNFINAKIEELISKLNKETNSKRKQIIQSQINSLM